MHTLYVPMLDGLRFAKDRFRGVFGVYGYSGSYVKMALTEAATAGQGGAMMCHTKFMRLVVNGDRLPNSGTVRCLLDTRLGPVCLISSDDGIAGNYSNICTSAGNVAGDIAGDVVGDVVGGVLVAEDGARIAVTDAPIVDLFTAAGAHEIGVTLLDKMEMAPRCYRTEMLKTYEYNYLTRNGKETARNIERATMCRNYDFILRIAAWVDEHRPHQTIDITDATIQSLISGDDVSSKWSGSKSIIWGLHDLVEKGRCKVPTYDPMSVTPYVNSDVLEVLVKWYAKYAVRFCAGSVFSFCEQCCNAGRIDVIEILHKYLPVSGLRFTSDLARLALCNGTSSINERLVSIIARYEDEPNYYDGLVDIVFSMPATIVCGLIYVNSRAVKKPDKFFAAIEVSEMLVHESTTQRLSKLPQSVFIAIGNFYLAHARRVPMPTADMIRYAAKVVASPPKYDVLNWLFIETTINKMRAAGHVYDFGTVCDVAFECPGAKILEWVAARWHCATAADGANFMKYPRPPQLPQLPRYILRKIFAEFSEPLSGLQCTISYMTGVIEMWDSIYRAVPPYSSNADDSQPPPAKRQDTRNEPGYMPVQYIRPPPTVTTRKRYGIEYDENLILLALHRGHIGLVNACICALGWNWMNITNCSIADARIMPKKSVDFVRSYYWLPPQSEIEELVPQPAKIDESLF